MENFVCNVYICLRDDEQWIFVYSFPFHFFVLCFKFIYYGGLNYLLMSLLLCIFRRNEDGFPVHMPNILALVYKFPDLHILEPASDNLFIYVS